LNGGIKTMKKIRIAGMWKMSIAKRLQYGLSSILAFMVLLTIAGLWGMSAINGRLEQITQVNNEKITLAQTMQNSSRVIDNAMLFSVVARDETATKNEITKATTARKEFMEALQKLEKIETSKKGKELLTSLKETNSIAGQASERIVPLLNSGDINQASTMILGSVQVSNMLSEACNEVMKFQQLNTKNAANYARVTYKTAALVLLIFSVAVICFAVFLSFSLKNSISKPLNRGVAIAQRIGEGDFTVTIDNIPADETGELLKAMKSMVEKLQGIIGRAKSVATEMAAASQQLNSSSDIMSIGAGEQATRANQVATASEEMSQTVVDIAKNTASIENSATETAKLAKEGEIAVDRSVEKVKAIAKTIDESGQLIKLLGDRSDQIGAILNVIIDIADQTNLLALNAAIEAARAGEAGRGFAVVADEVRKLAERTGSSTSEIGNMIKSIQDQVTQTVSSMDGMTKEVKSGVELSTQGADYLRHIVERVDQLHIMVQQIASATEEMAATSDEINRDIETIASVSQQTSGNSDQIAHASRKLANLSVDLEGVVAGFKI
jgi:methyl-accepting chemotaxis protein